MSKLKEIFKYDLDEALQISSESYLEMDTLLIKGSLYVFERHLGFLSSNTSNTETQIHTWIPFIEILSIHELNPLEN
jgi:hypothetical protein